MVSQSRYEVDKLGNGDVVGTRRIVQGMARSIGLPLEFDRTYCRYEKEGCSFFGAIVREGVGHSVARRRYVVIVKDRLILKIMGVDAKEAVEKQDWNDISRTLILDGFIDDDKTIAT
jgi:hypothetical protein